MVKTGVPDGSQEMPMASKPKAISIRGDSGSKAIGEDSLHVGMTDGSSPMDSNLRKGAWGAPITAKGPTTVADTTEFKPETPEPDAKKFGLGTGKYGAI